jgi:PsbP-like protein
MFCKRSLVWVFPLLFLLFIFFSIVYYIPFARAQQNNANFITYINTNLGFTIKHPSDWTVNDRNDNAVNGHKVISFTSQDRVGIIFVQIQNATQYEIAVYNMNNSAKTNTIRTHLTPGEEIIELDVSHYVLSGHPAIRIIETQSFGESGEPISSKPYDAKGVIYSIVLGEKFYKVAYMITPPERFPNYLQTAQSMINSFRIISKQ